MVEVYSTPVVRAHRAHEGGGELLTNVAPVTGEGLLAPASLAFNRDHKVLYAANLSTSASFPQPYAPALVQVTFPAPVVACGNGVR